MSNAANKPVVVIGAGPHGLAAASHLRAAGLQTLCFGDPLEFWRRHMPAGMVLRSRRRSTHISDPAGALRIERFEQRENRPVHDPYLLVEEFIEYGLWYQRHAVPEVDRRKVRELTVENRHFRLTLSDGTELEASRVVVAAGLVTFARRPAYLAELSPSQVSHSVDHQDLVAFAGQRVAVVGGGQSGLESAALLREAGATVELIIRDQGIHWLWSRDTEEPLPPPTPGFASPPTDLGDPLAGWIAAAPDLWRRFPPQARERIAYRCIRPAGAGWLRPRLRDVPVSFGRQIVRAQAAGEQLLLTLDDGSERTVDHVLLGTGYALDVTRYPFMTPSLASQLRLDHGYPLLGPGLESSIPGLHFVGAAAARSFGPVMRFVVGTHYAAPAVAVRARGDRQPLLRFSF